MKPFLYVIAICFLMVPAMQKRYDNILEELLSEPETRTASKEVLGSKIQEFIQEKLVQHTQALEYLLKMVQEIHEFTMTLVDNLSRTRTLEEPKKPEKIEVNEPVNRNADVEDKIASSKLSKAIPKLGSMFKELITRHVGNEEDPIPVIEATNDGINNKLNTRRSFNLRQNLDKTNPWCVAATMCVQTNNSACGYDDKAGFAKFDDVCHMLKVNCYWGANYSLVFSCPKT